MQPEGILSGVTGNLGLLQRLLDKDREEYEILMEAKKAASRTRDLTLQLITFAKGGAPAKEAASIEVVVRDATTLSLRGANTKAEYQFAEDLLSVEIDTGQIGQVIQNFVINADQAMPDGGIVKISAKNIELSGEEPFLLEAGNYVKVSVEDEGAGIPENLLPNIFDPYFSTKPTGHGLGLSISHSIIKRHGGYIAVHSEVGVGTMFAFYLPASEEQAVAGAEREEEFPRGTGRILLMDDEEMIHRIVGRALGIFGYEVDSVQCGDEALQAYKASLEAGSPYDIVIMDLTIPGGMGGKEAVGKLHEIDPHARAIVSSGYAADPVMMKCADYGFAGKVAKPVDIEELAGTVKRVLEGGES